MIWIALLCGMSVAAGCWLLVGGVRRPPPSLVLPVTSQRSGVSVATVRSLESTDGLGFGSGRPIRTGGVSGRSRSLRSVLHPQGLRDRSAWSTYRGLADDLRVVDDTLDDVIYQQVLSALAGFSFPLVLFLLILPLAGLSAPLAIVFLLALALGAGGFFLPLQTLRQDAAARRREFAAGLSHYVSFVDVLVSGGNSIDASFEFAADLGQGWVWDELRFAIASASSTTQAPYRALRDLGDDLGVVELTNLARRLEQTQSTGSAIGPALRSLADSLTKDQARLVKIADDEVTEKMTFPLMVVLCSLLTFFGIAAVSAILRAAQGF